MAYGPKQGMFKPKNPSKYKGDPTCIIYRSSWELKVMGVLDSNPNVIEWNSEEIIIPYRSPVDGRMHRYFTDFAVKTKKSDGTIEKSIIEIKPKDQCKPPVRKSKKPSKRYLNEVMTWGVNQAKWEAAREYCKKRGYKFQILTEDDLF
jgi:hypothetical protein